MLRKIQGPVLLFAALLSSGSLAAQDRLRAVSYGVRPGDEVTIQIFTSAGAQLQEVSGVRIVDPDGQIFLPYLGSVAVSKMIVASLPFFGTAAGEPA